MSVNEELFKQLIQVRMTLVSIETFAEYSCASFRETAEVLDKATDADKVELLSVVLNAAIKGMEIITAAVRDKGNERIDVGEIWRQAQDKFREAG